MILSIIILNWNTEKLLKKCLDSIIADRYEVLGDVSRAEKKITNTQPLIPNTKNGANTQPLSPNTEIIVVDNASTDGSVGYINELTKLRIKGLEFKTIFNKENAGFAKAVNQALRQAQGEVLLLLNSDTIVKDNALEKLVEFEKKVRPAIIGARLLSPDGQIQSSVFHLPAAIGAFKEYWLDKKGAFEKYTPEGTLPVKVKAVSGGAMLISREVIEKIGLLDERYFFYFEDLDFCRRAKKFNIPVYYLPSAEIIHEHGASGKKLASDEDQWKRLIPSAKIYYGWWNYFWINFIIRFGNKIRKLK